MLTQVTRCCIQTLGAFIRGEGHKAKRRNLSWARVPQFERSACSCSSSRPPVASGLQIVLREAWLLSRKNRHLEPWQASPSSPACAKPACPAFSVRSAPPLAPTKTRQPQSGGLGSWWSRRYGCNEEATECRGAATATKWRQGENTPTMPLFDPTLLPTLNTYRGDTMARASVGAPPAESGWGASSRQGPVRTPPHGGWRALTGEPYCHQSGISLVC
jgi:hypothetical protein